MVVFPHTSAWGEWLLRASSIVVHFIYGTSIKTLSPLVSLPFLPPESLGVKSQLLLWVMKEGGDKLDLLLLLEDPQPLGIATEPQNWWNTLTCSSWLYQQTSKIDVAVNQQWPHVPPQELCSFLAHRRLGTSWSRCSSFKASRTSRKGNGTQATTKCHLLLSTWCSCVCLLSQCLSFPTTMITLPWSHDYGLPLQIAIWRVLLFPNRVTCSGLPLLWCLRPRGPRH